MFKNILHSLLTKGLVAVINFLLLVISAKYLGISSRGEISLFILNLTIIQAINEVYTGYTLIYFIPKFDLRRLFVAGVIYTLIFSSLSNVVIVFLNRQVKGFEWLGYVISLLIIINTFNCVLILGKEKVGRYNLLSFLQPLLLLVGLVFYVVVLKDFTFNAYVYPLLVSFVIAIIVSGSIVFEMILREKKVKMFAVKPLLINGFFCQAGILMYIFCNRYSYYLLSSSAKVGLYSSASSLIEAVLIIANGISAVLLARVANQRDTIRSGEITLSLSKASLLFSSLAIFVIYLLPEDFFLFILGNGFKGIKHYMMLYAPGVLMMSVFGIVTNYFSAIGKINIVMLCNAVGFAAALALAPTLIAKYDISGAAYTADIAYLGIVITVYFAFFKSERLSWKRLFSFHQDFLNLKELVSSKSEL